MVNYRSCAPAAMLVSLAVLAACNGSSTMPSSAQSVALPQRVGDDGHSRSVCLKRVCIYVGNYGSGSVTVYGVNANGNVAPNQAIHGNRTGLYDVFAVAVDATRNIYAANNEGGYIFYEGSVTVYPAGSNGNASPIATIQGTSDAEMINPSGVAIDAAGNIYASGQSSNSVSVYAPGSNGNATPLQYIQGSDTGLSEPTSMAVAADGTMFVTNWTAMDVTVYASGATGNVAPIRTIGGSKTGIYYPNAVAVDAKGRVYVSSTPNGSPAGCCVTVYAKNANGNAAPIRSISGSNTQIDLPYGIAVDSDENIYVTQGGTNSVNVYSKSANGNVAPVRVISGSKTKLDVPTDLIVR